MLQLRCTKKVQKEFGLRPGELAEVKSGGSLLGDWYINIFTVDRRKTLIFMNERTLLSFIIFGVKKSNIKKMPEIFLNGLGQILTIEGIELNRINRVLEGYESYEFTKTSSKKLIGNMNDLVEMYKHFILYDGGFKNCDVGSIILQINRTPQRNLEWSNSIEVAKELLRAKQDKAT